jgi:hypothetical protein
LTLSIVWYCNEHVLETGSVSILREWETPLLGLLERVKPRYSLEYWTMDKVQKPSHPKCHTPSSEPFRIYLILSCILVMKHKATLMLHLFLEHKTTTINVSGLAM